MVKKSKELNNLLYKYQRVELLPLMVAQKVKP